MPTFRVAIAKYILEVIIAKVKAIQALEPKAPLIVPHEIMLPVKTRDPFLFLQGYQRG
jgi:hypothetical protein